RWRSVASMSRAKPSQWPPLRTMPSPACRKKARPSSATSETRMRSPLRNAPAPRRAVYSSAVTGLWITPTVTSPRSSSAISVAQIPMPRTKFFVPSMGSMIQRTSFVPRPPNSSPRTPQSGKARPAVGDLLEDRLRHLLARRAHVERGVDVGAHLVGPVQRGQRGDGAQLALLLRQDLAAVQDPGEEHRQLARQALVELLPQLEAGAALERMEEHLRRPLRPLLQGLLVHAVALRSASVSTRTLSPPRYGTLDCAVSPRRRHNNVAK